MGTASGEHHAAASAARVTNPEGASPYVFTCDHASNFVPPAFGTLGLAPEEFERHIAWDPGALPVARLMAKALDATLVETCVSRLIIDCNRPLDAHNLIPETSETTTIPGNAGLSAADRQARIDLAWRPFHDAVEQTIEARLAAGRETRLVSVHSFTPVYFGKPRPWPVGIIHGSDERFSAAVRDALHAESPDLLVGWNEPYSRADGVTLTLERHGDANGLDSVMIEVRNDELATPDGILTWGRRLATALHTARAARATETENAERLARGEG